MRLVRGHVEMPHAQREVDRVEIFEGCGQVGKVKDEKQKREDPSGPACADARLGVRRAKACHIGRRNSPSDQTTRLLSDIGAAAFELSVLRGQADRALVHVNLDLQFAEYFEP